MSKNKKIDEAKFPHYEDNSCIEGFANEAKMSAFLRTFCDLLERERCKSHSSKFKDEKAIDFDAYETSLKKKCKGQEEPTVDCIVGLEIKQLMLVEMKFGVRTLKMNNVAKNIKDKRTHSICQLRTSTSYRCYEKVIVLLKDEKFELHKNCLTKQLSNDVKHFEILRVSDFYDKYFSKRVAS